jgi:N-acetylneuraminic acid mutarotase
LYDPATGAWTPTGNLATMRIYHTATLLRDGRVLVVGGGDRAALGTGEEFVAGAEIYNPAAGTWTPTGGLNTGREFHTATLLPDGRVLVAGGDTRCHPGGAELYDSSTGAWTNAGDLVSFRYNHTATLLPNGSVLLVGGVGLLTSTEVFDPTSGAWTSVGHLATARTQHTATLLNNGSILIIGGIGYDALTSVEMYTPRNSGR